MTRIRAALLLVGLVTSLAAAVASASATTSPANYRIFKVQLTDRGVTFSPKAQLSAGEVGLFKVRNLSRTPRTFFVSTRGTHLLTARKSEAFYEIFPSRGKVKWMSHASRGKSFTGFLKVVPCKTVNGTSCNGTSGG